MKFMGLDTAKNVLSGKTTHDRVAAAERQVVTAPTKPKKKKKPTATEPNLVKPKQKYVDARQKAIEAQQAADRKAIAERNMKYSLRSK